MMAKLAGLLMGVKNTTLASRKSQIVLILILVKKFIQRQVSHGSNGSKYCFINNTNELRLLISSAFSVKKDRQDDNLP